ncbi:MAG TPA: 6-phosphogluconolactonase [Actinobacteria bacterium]|nr:6-phosphogluconolactonase [Actinomycetota bacterium]
MHVVVRPQPADAAAAAAELLAGHLAAAGAPIDLGLAGGTTPRAAYRLLRDRDLPWDRVWCWLPDERWVPPNHPDSNARMVREELLDHVPASFDAPNTATTDPHRAAAEYENRILPRFLRGGAVAPDLVLLGVGADGHTASLFPHTEAVSIDRIGYVANWVPALGAWRLTATLPLLRAARKVVFLVTGREKAPVVAQILEREIPHPARLVAEGAAEAVWILDEAAAAELS